MKLFPISSILSCPSLSYLDRTWYVTATNCCLTLLVNYWTSSSIIIWSLDITSNNFLWWVFTITHSIAWYLIYCSTIMLDLPDLLGIRQIVEHCSSEKVRQLINFLPTELLIFVLVPLWEVLAEIVQSHEASFLLLPLIDHASQAHHDLGQGPHSHHPLHLHVHILVSRPDWPVISDQAVG